MYYYELFKQGPGVYVPILLLSLLITMLAYGAFPLIFATTRRKYVTKKKFNILCYVINFFIIFVFVALGSKPWLTTYMLWTWIFSSIGSKIMDRKGVFEAQSSENSQKDAEDKINDASKVDKGEVGRDKQKKSIPNKKILTLGIINFVVIVFVLVLSIVGARSNDGDLALIVIFCIISIVLHIIDIVKSKTNIFCTVILLFSLIMMTILYTIFEGIFYSSEYECILFCVLYLLIYTICQLIFEMFFAYRSTTRYKIKCYKKIEQLNTYRDKGIIAEEEFEKAREQIMSKIRY